MTLSDRDLAVMVQEAIRLEQAVREAWKTAGTDEAEKDSALVVMRLATPLRRSLEMWMSTRALRAALKT